MTCDICGMCDTLTKMSSFNLFFVLKFRHFLKCIDKSRAENLMRNFSGGETKLVKNGERHL